MQIGQKLAGYELIGPLGRGGMGEVWRAKDEQLGREVALKVLPGDFADDPERHARFEREAKLLASLNHPNIATLFDLEHADLHSDPDKPDTETVEGSDSDSSHVLVMELVEGEGLDQRIARGPISAGEAIPIALQVAEALEAAHEQGIVHRDLKPANVMIRPDGGVKVLDFGLAKAWEAEMGNDSLSLSPTITQHQTQAGVILGTAAYMSPEQAAGVAADRRADIWSFGVVLWEMLTGQQLFGGETVSHVLASVLKDEIDLGALPKELSPKLLDLVARCLVKEPRRRVQSIGDVRVALEEYLEDPDAADSGTPFAAPAYPKPSLMRRVLPWVTAVLFGVVTAGLVWAVVRHPAPVIKAAIPAPAEQEFHLNPANPGPVAVSPDGQRLAFSARSEDGEVQLYVRRLDSTVATALSGTSGAAYPFWSPDSRWLAFFTGVDGTLKKIDVTGGPPITLCGAPNGKGGSWSPDGIVIFTPSPTSPIHRVSSAGGESTPITEIAAEKYNSHRHPRFLPDGKHFLFLARGNSADSSDALVTSVDGGEPRVVVSTSTQAEYRSGHLLFVRDRTLMAQAFDPQKLQTTAEAVPLAEDVLVVTGASLAIFSASDTGVVSFQTGQAEVSTTLEWQDRAGQPIGTLGDGGFYRSAILSPNGKYAATEIVDLTLGTADLWIYEIGRDLRTRFTFDSHQDSWPVWTPDGEAVIFASNRGGQYDIFRKRLGGAGEAELVYASDKSKNPTSVSPDGKVLVFHQPGEDSQSEIWVLPLEEPGAEPQPVRQSEFLEGSGIISPDGNWLAYHSDESGNFEVYVTTFPEPGRRWQISKTGGVYPQWRGDGKGIVYSQIDGNLVSTSVAAEGGTFQVGRSENLATIQAPLIGGPYFSATADHEQFLVVPSVVQHADTLLNLVVNWPATIDARR